jgi:hypothetical protein
MIRNTEIMNTAGMLVAFSHCVKKKMVPGPAADTGTVRIKSEGTGK